MNLMPRRVTICQSVAGRRFVLIRFIFKRHFKNFPLTKLPEKYFLASCKSHIYKI